jgi:pre-60S factor REI1
MHAMHPSRPMELVEHDEAGGKVLRCYTAPGETFANEDEMKEHYRTELHRFNLKRKVTGLAPLSRAQFEVRASSLPACFDELRARRPPLSRAPVCLQEREALGARDADAKGGPPAKLTTAERRQQRDERREQRVAAKSKNPHSKAAHLAATAEMSEGQYLSHKLSQAPEFGPGSDLFSRYTSESLEANLAHMAREHGFYLPCLDFCVDVAGLVQYLQQKVYIGNVALLTDRQFHSVEAVQAHMRSKRQCRVELEGHEDELGEFYDMEALAAGSPLCELEPASDSEEEEVRCNTRPDHRI